MKNACCQIFMTAGNYLSIIPGVNRLILGLLLLVATSVTGAEDPPATTQSASKETTVEGDPVPRALNFTLKTLEGKDRNLVDYLGKVVLMVNVASKCGLTPQYKALQTLHEKYAAKGLSILGFPANDFGAQEPGSDEQIGEFCERNYGVKFDMFSKIVVTGTEKHPLYQTLTTASGERTKPGEITWNFEKFLLDRQGNIVARFAPGVTPDSKEVDDSIEAELAK